MKTFFAALFVLVSLVGCKLVGIQGSSGPDSAPKAASTSDGGIWAGGFKCPGCTFVDVREDAGGRGVTQAFSQVRGTASGAAIYTDLKTGYTTELNQADILYYKGSLLAFKGPGSDFPIIAVEVKEGNPIPNRATSTILPGFYNSQDCDLERWPLNKNDMWVSNGDTPCPGGTVGNADYTPSRTVLVCPGIQPVRLLSIVCTPSDGSPSIAWFAPTLSSDLRIGLHADLQVAYAAPEPGVYSAMTQSGQTPSINGISTFITESP